MGKTEKTMTWDGWTCHECAVKAGLRYPEGHVSSCVFGKCPKCGRERDLTPETDYERESSNANKPG